MSKAMKGLRKSIVRCRIMALAIPLLLSTMFILAFWSVDFTVPRNIVRDVFDFDDDYDNVDFNLERPAAEVANDAFRSNHHKNRMDENTVDTKNIVNKDALDKKVDQNTMDKKTVDENTVDKKKVDENTSSQKKVDENTVDKKNMVSKDALDKKTVDENTVDKKKVDEKSSSQKKVDENTVDKKNMVSKDALDKKTVAIVDKSSNNEKELLVTNGAVIKSEEKEAIPKVKSVNERMMETLEANNFVPVLLPPKAPSMNASELASLRSEAHKMYAARLESVQRVCSDNKMGRIVRNNSFKPIWQRHLYRLEPFHIGYCSITKTASTTWLHHLARLMGVQKVYTGRLTVMGNAKLYAQQKMRENFSDAIIPEDDFSKINEKELAKTLNFVVVRHPFKRLVSAFVNKFVDFPGINEMAPIKNYVIKHFRDPHERDMKNPKLLFHEFVPYMLERISLQEELNEHFAPQWQSCPFCHLNFDVIGNLETINRDNDFVMNGLKIRNILLPTLAFNRVKGDYTMKAESVSLADQLFARITKSQVRALAQYYDIDFKMFGFDDMQHYIDIAKDDPK